ncbi:unnamed protein product [Knipowitschia caucasica]|uniref:Immunoglobulin subtype domain-containing protein n=1 Tax=Knipowitschia caucasica TaxID=637954 RepID=A0AAV2LYE2_KNICA
MNFVFVVLLLLNFSRAHGQQIIEENRDVLLRLTFPPFYNSYAKSCCKLYPGGCYVLMSSDGFVCEYLGGRVTRSQGDGWVQFVISNAHFSDQGFYRCAVVGTPIYSDYYVEVKDTSDPLLSHKTTSKAHGVSTELEPTGPVVEQDLSDPHRDRWSFPLSAVISVAAVICISSTTALVFCCVKAKQKQSYTKHAESSPTDTTPETSTIYTTVDFKAHQKPIEIYENLRSSGSQGQRAPQPVGQVEYSTLAVHQHP